MKNFFKIKGLVLVIVFLSTQASLAQFNYYNSVQKSSTGNAVGRWTKATGSYSTAMGFDTEATAPYSTALGYKTITKSFASISMGRYNVGYGTNSYTNMSDPIFELGVGTSNTNRLNAITVLKDGKIGLGIGAAYPEFPLVVGSNWDGPADLVISDQSPAIGFLDYEDNHHNFHMYSDVDKFHISTTTDNGFGNLSQIMTLQSNKFIGIGTKNPKGSLDVGGKEYKNFTDGNGDLLVKDHIEIGGYIYSEGNSQKGYSYFAGNVAIGTKKTDGLLTVAGKIHAREVQVTANAGADFVFNKDYQLTPLSQLEAFVTQNKHLPEIPSEKEMIEKGVNMGEFQIKLLQKIEELTLYVIDLKKENDHLKQGLEMLSNK